MTCGYRMRMVHTLNIGLVLLASLLAILLALQSISALPAPSTDRVRSSEPLGSSSGGGGSELIRQQPPDKCPRGVCENKGKICEVICKNNPSEGGKFCNCDTYALRATGPSFTNCNRLM